MYSSPSSIPGHCDPDARCCRREVRFRAEKPAEGYRRSPETDRNSAKHSERCEDEAIGPQNYRLAPKLLDRPACAALHFRARQADSTFRRLRVEAEDHRECCSKEKRIDATPVQHR